MTRTSVAVMVVMLGCRPDVVDGGPVVKPETDSAAPPPPNPTLDGADETAGGEGPETPRQRVCSVYLGDDADVQGDTYRHHCSGVARPKVKAKLEVTSDQVDQQLLEFLEEDGLGVQINFGPNYHGGSFDDAAVIACCEHEYDYPNTPQPTAPDAEHAWACAVDCIDQLCRAIPDNLRDLAEDPAYKVHLKNHPIPCAIEPGTPCYYDEIWALANYVAAHHQACVTSFLQDTSPPYSYQVTALGGELDFDAWIAANDPGASAAWPSISQVVIEGKCGIDPPDGAIGSGWQLPPGPLQACADSNDNNDEEPFGADSGHGGGLGGPDTFELAETSAGRLEVEGPVLLVGHLGGAAPVKGASGCEPEPCTSISLGVRHGTLRLEGLQLTAAERVGLLPLAPALAIAKLRVHLARAARTNLVRGHGGTSTFAFEPGAVEAVATGVVYGLPISLPIRNTTPLRGTITQAEDGFATQLTLAPVTFGGAPRHGRPWQIHAELGAWLPYRRAPRARFDIEHADGRVRLDARASTDADGDPLTFTWYVDGLEAGADVVLEREWDTRAIHVVVLHVADATGRTDWVLRLLPRDASTLGVP
jgi:hypothetical protein